MSGVVVFWATPRQYLEIGDPPRMLAMHYILGRFRADIDAWKEAREAYREHHEQEGQHFQRAWVNVDDPGEIFFLFAVDDLDRAKASYEAADALDLEKQQRGEIPEVFFLEER